MEIVACPQQPESAERLLLPVTRNVLPNGTRACAERQCAAVFLPPCHHICLRIAHAPWSSPAGWAALCNSLPAAVHGFPPSAPAAACMAACVMRWSSCPSRPLSPRPSTLGLCARLRLLFQISCNKLCHRRNWASFRRTRVRETDHLKSSICLTKWQRRREQNVQRKLRSCIPANQASHVSVRRDTTILRHGAAFGAVGSVPSYQSFVKRRCAKLSKAVHQTTCAADPQFHAATGFESWKV